MDGQIKESPTLLMPSIVRQQDEMDERLIDQIDYEKYEKDVREKQDQKKNNYLIYKYKLFN